MYIAAVVRALQRLGSGPLYDALQALMANIQNGGGPSVSGAGTFILRPGQPSSGNAFATEAELLAAIANIDAPVVGFDLRNIAPNPFVLTQNWNMRGGQWFSVFPVTDAFKVVIPEPFTVTDLFGIRNGLGVHLARTATAAFVSSLPISLSLLAVVEGSVLDNAGSFPGLGVVQAGKTQVVAVELAGGITLSGGTEIIRTVGAATVIATNIAASRLLNQSFPDGWITGAAPGQLTYVEADASFVPPAVPGFTGTVNPTNYIDHALGVLYDDSLVAPSFGARDVQGMLDILKKGGPYCFGADALVSLVLNSFMRLGSALATTLTVDIGARAARLQRISAFWVSHAGNPLNVGQTVTYFLMKNGNPIPNATVTLPADVDASANPTLPFAVVLDPGDLLQMVASPFGGALTATVTSIEGTVD